MSTVALAGYGPRACFSGPPVHPFGWPSERWSSCMPSAACSMCSALLGGELGAHRRRTSRSPRRTSSCSGRNSCEGASDRADSRSLATRNESACIDVPLRLCLSIYLILGHALLLLGLLDVVLLCAPKSPPKSALHIEQAADGMHDDRRSLDHPKGWTGAPEKHARDPYPPRADARTHLVPQEGEAARWRQQVGA